VLAPVRLMLTSVVDWCLVTLCRFDSSARARENPGSGPGSYGQAGPGVTWQQVNI
jgi:hypothetical protein